MPGPRCAATIKSRWRAGAGVAPGRRARADGDTGRLRRCDRLDDVTPLSVRKRSRPGARSRGGWRTRTRIRYPIQLSAVGCAVTSRRRPQVKALADESHDDCRRGRIDDGDGRRIPRSSRGCVAARCRRTWPRSSPKRSRSTTILTNVRIDQRSPPSAPSRLVLADPPRRDQSHRQRD